MIYSPPQRALDAVAAALNLIRTHVPTATTAHLHPDDTRIGVGYLLADITTPDGLLSATNPALLPYLQDAIADLLRDVSWGSAIRENRNTLVAAIPL